MGNVVLKLTEGVAGTLLGMLKDIFMQSIVTKLCYLGVKGGLRNLKHMMDSEEIGGAPLLGAAKPVIKAHGSSKAKGIKNAIRQAKLCVANDLCGTMQSALAEVAAKAQQKRQTRNKTAYRAKIEMLCPPIGNGRYQNIGSGRTMCAPTG